MLLSHAFAYSIAVPAGDCKISGKRGLPQKMQQAPLVCLGQIEFPVQGVAHILHGLVVVLKFSGVVEEHHAEDQRPDRHQLALPDLGGVAGGGQELGVQGLGQRAELGALFVIEIVEVLILQHQNGPVLGVFHEEADVAQDDRNDLLAQGVIAFGQDLLLPGGPDVVDIVDDGGHEFLLVLEMAVGRSAGNAAGLRSTAQGEALDPLAVELLDTGQDQRFPQITVPFRHNDHPFQLEVSSVNCAYHIPCGNGCQCIFKSYL